MYDVIWSISNFFSEPFFELFYRSKSIPLLAAFILGIVGALAPCQFTANLGAITIYGNRSFQQKVAWSEVFYFILGKIVVFSGFGLLVWLLGNSIEQTLTLYFPGIRKLVGPLLIIIGIFMLGLIKARWTLSLGQIPQKLVKKGKLGAFLMGISFSLGFCPTMFVLFFVTLLPFSFTVGYGFILPSVFAIGTSIPLIIAVFLIWYFELSNATMKRTGRKTGAIIQKTAGVTLIVLGIIDTLTYWGI